MTKIMQIMQCNIYMHIFLESSRRSRITFSTANGIVNKLKLTQPEQVPRWTGHKTVSQHAKYLTPSQVCWHHLMLSPKLQVYNVSEISNIGNHSWVKRSHLTGRSQNQIGDYYINEKDAKFPKKYPSIALRNRHLVPKVILLEKSTSNKEEDSQNVILVCKLCKISISSLNDYVKSVLHVLKTFHFFFFALSCVTKW